MSLFDKMGVVSPELQSGVKDLFSGSTLEDLTGSVLNAGRDALKEKVNKVLGKTPEGRSAAKNIVVTQAQELAMNPLVWLGVVGVIVGVILWRRG